MPTNNHSNGDEPSASYPIHPRESALPGLVELVHAYACARNTGIDPWDFALEIEKLYETGLTISDLRWLVAKGFVEHANERSDCGDSHRSFDPSAGFNFDTRTCLVLTADGAAFATRFIAASHDADLAGEPPSTVDTDPAETLEEHPPEPSGGRASGFLLPSARPQWRSDRRELYFGDELVKRFRVPARNQEWILDVFEEDNWPEFIDDPLPQSPDICPKTRLHDAINRLNHKQIQPLLRFHGNGNGKGVYWEVV